MRYGHGAIETEAEACRAYRKKRRNRGGARRDLEDLRAAIGHHAAEGYHREIVKVSLPEKGEPRDKWLTRSDAAKLIWTCWRYRELQKRSRRPIDDVRAPTAKRPLRHLARFILLGIYSGTRAGAIAAASPIPALGRSYVDLERGRYYRRNWAPRRPTSANLRSRSLALACPSAAMAPDRCRGKAFRGVQWQAGKLGQDGLQERRQARGTRSRNITSHVATHGGDLAAAQIHGRQPAI